MRCFPMCVNIENEMVFLVGNGPAAVKKLERLQAFGAVIRWFRGIGETRAEEKEEQLFGEALASTESNNPYLIVEPRKLAEADLLSYPVFVVAAGLEEKEGQRVSLLCKMHNIPVNVEDMPKLCTFYFPAIINRGVFTMSISTGGRCPMAAAVLKQHFEEQIPEDMDEKLERICEIREQLKSEISDPEERKSVLRQEVYRILEEG